MIHLFRTSSSRRKCDLKKFQKSGRIWILPGFPFSTSAIDRGNPLYDETRTRFPDHIEEHACFPSRQWSIIINKLDHCTLPPIFQKMSTTHTCSRTGCTNPATKKCPVCISYGIPDSYFCSQDCLKQAWKDHKAYHDQELNKM